MPEQKQKKKYILRNPTADLGSYFRGKETFYLEGKSHVILDYRPSLMSGELTIREYEEVQSAEVGGK